jgi:hypothetical protein
MDPPKRLEMMHEAFPARAREDLHDPAPPAGHPWAVRKGIHAQHRADNVLEATWVRID